MSSRWGLGPVFVSEWRANARRWQIYAGRSLFAGILLAGLSSVWVGQIAGRPDPTIHDMARIGGAFFRAIMFTQLTLVLLAAPATMAGAICQDKARGNLAQMMITDLSDAEIVLGKVAARLVPVFGMICCTLPVLALGTLLGGIDPLALTGLFAITSAVAVLACAITLAFSTWGSKPYEVLLATFAVLAIWLLATPVWQFFSFLRGYPPPPNWASSANPYILAWTPYGRSGSMGLANYLGFLAATLGLSALLVLLSIARIRRVVIRQADRTTSRRRGEEGLAGFRIGPRRPSLEDDPALWYEWHRRRPSPWIRAMIRIYFTLAAGFSLLAVEDALRPSSPAPAWLSGYVNGFQVTFALPLLLVAAATALVEERARGSLDVLLTTPLSSKSIVLAKWWSVFRELATVSVLPVLVAALLAWKTGRWSGLLLFVLQVVTAGAAWTSLGLALSTWLRRVGRAIAWVIILYAFVGLGWPILASTVFDGPWWDVGHALTAISPFYGLFDLTTWMGMAPGEPNDFTRRNSLICTILQALVAGGVLLATLATFDRCLGRIREGGGRSSPRPPSPIRTPALSQIRARDGDLIGLEADGRLC